MKLVRGKARTMFLDEAVELAVDECIRKGVLAEFLSQNRAKAIAVSIFEYDEVKEKEKMRKAEYQAGHERGRTEGRAEAHNQINELNRRLLHDGGSDNLMKALEDSEYQQKLLSEYGL